jgi:nucleoside phosphorylase
MAASRRLPHEAYTVGWICALPTEMAAAVAMLDEQHDRLSRNQTDQNNYVLGSFDKHNVAIACLPLGVTGTNPAATVANNMLSTFKSIRFGLVVGIGGGAPSENVDIRLGDVVVSKPDATYGGVVQYDFGKTVGKDQFIHTGTLNKPPLVLLAAVSSLATQHILEGDQLQKHLSEMRIRNQETKLNFRYQGAENDQLFEPEYDHVENSKTCEHCDARKLVDRRERTIPRIHYGPIASGNQDMRDGATREHLRKQYGVLCFEMEAAGLMDNFPCLIIRGICDYADSHKNKRWQGYAAATAAAYAKELLCIIPASEVENTPTAAIAEEGKSALQVFTTLSVS